MNTNPFVAITRQLSKINVNLLINSFSEFCRKHRKKITYKKAKIISLLLLPVFFYLILLFGRLYINLKCYLTFGILRGCVIDSKEHLGNKSLSAKDIANLKSVHVASATSLLGMKTRVAIKVSGANVKICDIWGESIYYKLFIPVFWEHEPQ